MGDAERLGGFGLGETGEIAALDQLDERGVDLTRSPLGIAFRPFVPRPRSAAALARRLLR